MREIFGTAQMAKSCTKCEKTPCIRINLLGYCRGCFEEQLLAKVAKHLHGLTPDTRVLLYLSESHASAALCQILEKFFAKRARISVVAYCKNRELLIDCSFETCTEDLSDDTVDNTEPGERVLQYCRDRSIGAVIYQRSLERIIAASLEMLCDGDGLSAVQNTITKSIDGVRLINPFCGVKEKEIAYYMYLNGIRRHGSHGPVSKVRRALVDFLYETEDKNGLALFNIINTLRKLG